MDEFGVLVESIGFKPYGKSAPMAKSKSKPKPKSTPNNSSSSLADDSSSLPVDMLDGVFRSTVNINKATQHDDFLGGDDVFGASSSHFGEVDLESVLNISKNNNSSGNLNSVGSDGHDDLLGLNSEKSDRVGDDIFGGVGADSSENKEKKDDEVEDLIPGFGGASPSNKGVHLETNSSPGSNVNPSNSSSAVENDPFVVLESSTSQSAAPWPFDGPSEQETREDTVQVSLDDLDDFVMGHNDSSTDRSRNKTDQPSGTISNEFKNLDDIDALFGGVQQKPPAGAPSTAEDPPVDIFFSEEKGSQVKQTSSRSSSNSKNASSTSTGDDFTSLFGDVTTSSGEFHEIEGEPEERRRARLNSHMRTNARVAEALAEMNKRDLQSQYEQEEKHRVAESLDNQIKLWAAGKEGNLRALLSSLQQVLWPECGWRAVSLTDLITSDSVKKVYKKAALYVHPDKVQQKGANIQQKYIAEKVFDLLKEAWNKFSAEELR